MLNQGEQARGSLSFRFVQVWKGVRKRGALGKDSYLELYKINMLDVNLEQLVRGKSYAILYTIFKNRFKVSFFTLANIRANTFTLIDTKYAKKVL